MAPTYGAGLLVLHDQLSAGRTCDTMATGLEGNGGWVVQTDDAGILIAHNNKLACCSCLGSCRCSWEQLLEGLLGRAHLVAHLQ